MIEKYKFGSIVVNSQEYNHDILVSWQGKVSDWQKETSHDIDLPAIKNALVKSPEIIVIGTGASGVAQLSPAAREEILEKGIKLIVDKTPAAVKAFNYLEEKGVKVIGLFHLTC